MSDVISCGIFNLMLLIPRPLLWIKILSDSVHTVDIVDAVDIFYLFQILIKLQIWIANR